MGLNGFLHIPCLISSVGLTGSGHIPCPVSLEGLSWVLTNTMSDFASGPYWVSPHIMSESVDERGMIGSLHVACVIQFMGEGWPLMHIVCHLTFQ